MVDIRSISPELAAKARDELNEVESRIPEDVAALRTWIEKQPHLNARTDDQFLLTFLRGSKYNIEEAKQKIDYYYTIRSFSPEIFLEKPVDDKVLRLARLGHFTPLLMPLGPGGPRIHITRYGNIDLNEFQVIDLCKYQLRVFDIEMQEDDNSIIGGTINIVDMSNVSLGFLLQFDPSLMKKNLVFSEKAIPIRIHGIHVINFPKEATTLINISRRCRGEKLGHTMHLHTSFDTLYEHVPKECLPEEYGGQNGKLEDAIDALEKRLIGYKDFFEEDTQYGVNEELRVGEKVTSQSLFGLDDSFRKLEID